MKRFRKWMLTMNRIGEKILEWTDEDPPVEKILETVTLYWLTETMPRSMYHNRGVSWIQ